MTTTLKCDAGEEIKLYPGGYKSLATLTVKDRSGNTETLTFGDMDSNYYREVVINTRNSGKLEVTYSLSCGQNITAAACVKAPGTLAK